MKKKLINILILCIVIIAMCFSCSECAMDHTYPIFIENMSKHAVDAYAAFDLNGYPDTILPSQRRGFLLTIGGMEKKYIDVGIEYDKLFRYMASDTLSIFFFHTDTLNKYPWDIVRDNYMVLKRYDLSLPDLEKLDFKVPYPPSATMSDMKMYPPYNQK